MGCDYMSEEGVGKWWCSLGHNYVDDDTFYKYCYHSLDYHDCPVWKKEDVDSDGSARRTQGDNCYLTTACTVAMNLPDNCYELEMLRGFRDSYLKKQPYGMAAIEEYYRIAPQIVKEISQRSDSTERWKALYRKLVLPCVDMVKNSRYEDAYELYKKTSLELKDEYLSF